MLPSRCTLQAHAGTYSKPSTASPPSHVPVCVCILSSRPQPRWWTSLPLWVRCFVRQYTTSVSQLEYVAIRRTLLNQVGCSAGQQQQQQSYKHHRRQQQSQKHHHQQQRRSMADGLCIMLSVLTSLQSLDHVRHLPC